MCKGMVLCLSMGFAERLTLLIEECDTNQSRLARATGIGQTTISNLAGGKQRPYFDQAAKLAAALGVSLDRLSDEPEAQSILAPSLGEAEQTALDMVRELGLTKGEAFREPVGSRVVIVKNAVTSRRVRVVEGANVGSEGWIQKEFVRPVPRAAGVPGPDPAPEPFTPPVSPARSAPAVSPPPSDDPPATESAAERARRERQRTLELRKKRR